MSRQLDLQFIGVKMVSAKKCPGGYWVDRPVSQYRHLDERLTVMIPEKTKLIRVRGPKRMFK